ncbi:MAG TPA: ATP-binding protein [Acetobacteraceae bacterium]|nr:ATP-binding protein [Acetobacteraceae bacterium]
MPRPATVERHVFLSTVPPSAGERRTAVLFATIASAVFLALAPFAKVKLGEAWAFIPIYQSALLVNDLITAIMLFAQFVILGSSALVVLAGGYLFAALMAVPHTMSFPRLFAPNGLIGAGPQTTAWLYIIWRSGFPIALIAYVMLRDGVPVRRPGLAVMVTCAAVALAVILAAMLTTWGHSVLPAVMIGDRYTSLLPIAISSVLVLNIAATLVLWRQPRHSALDVWLLVVMVTRLFDISLAALLNGGRFDLGFYAGRVFGLIAASIVLAVLLVETAALYARLARSFEVERHDRERELRELQAELIHVSRLTELGQMVSALAHEVNQPLTAVGSYVRGGLRLLRANELARADDALEKASDQVTRASQTIQRLRQFVKKDESEFGAEDIRETIEEAAALALLGAEGRRVRLDMDFAADTPLVFIDKVRVQQVLLNLIRNSVEAMQGCERRDLTIRAQAENGMVEISVSDTGPGLPQDVRERLFQPFVTTKVSGMGVGLSICRSIVEAQGGRLWLADRPGGGAEFHFTLPVAQTVSA